MLPYASSCHCRYWEYPSELQAAAAFTPSHLGKDQTLKGGTYAEVGLKPKLSLRGGATKEEKCKSFHAAAQAVNQIPKIGLVNPVFVEYLNRQ